MKLHANAALSFRQRERMVRGVIEQGVAADAGRRGGRSQRAHLLEVGGPLAREIRRQLAQSRVAMMPGPASRRLVVVRLSSERACQALRPLLFLCHETGVSPWLLLVVPSGCARQYRRRACIQPQAS